MRTLAICLALAIVLICSIASAQWVQTNGPSGGFVHALAVSGANLFAGTSDGGVWRRPLSEMVTIVQPIGIDLPHTFVLGQNYPNPFNPTTVIRYQLPEVSDVKLFMYDMLGREVSVLVNESRDAGVHKVKFDGPNLASGVYLYQIQVGDVVQSKKLIILK